MQLAPAVLSCPGCSRVVPSRPRPFSPCRRANERGPRRDGWGRYLAPTNHPAFSQIRPGKRRSISRVFPRVSLHTHTQQQIPTTGAHKRSTFGPSPGPPYSPAPIRVAVKVLSHGSSCLELMFPPHPLPLSHCNIVWRAWPAFCRCHPSGRHAQPVYLPTSCLLAACGI